MNQNSNESFEYLQVLWKRKWLIMLGPFCIAVLAGIVALIIEPVYEIDAIIQPGKFFIQNQAGNFEEFVVEAPQQIADKILHRSYDPLISQDLGLERVPQIRAQNIRNTLLTRIWIRSADVEESKKTLNSLIDYVKKEIDEKILIEKNNVDAKIKFNEITKERVIKEVDIQKKRLTIINQRKNDIRSEMAVSKSRAKEFEKEQAKVLKQENRSDAESLALLLYSTELQKVFQYQDLLNEKLSAEKLKEEATHSKIEEELARIRGFDATITNLREQKGRIDYTKIVKEPASSEKPIFPNIPVIVLTAIVAGLVFFSFIAFFAEYIQRNSS